MDGQKVKPFRFISFKEMNKFQKKYDQKVFTIDYKRATFDFCFPKFSIVNSITSPSFKTF